MILSGWKEIAGHLRRGVRTVQRWEHFGLPVHRPAGRSRAAVFAISEEIDNWAQSRPNGRPEQKAFGRYFRQHPIARIQETFSETEKLMAELRLHTVKQQHLLGLLRQASRKRRAKQPRLATGPVVEIRRGFPPMGANHACFVAGSPNQVESAVRMQMIHPESRPEKPQMGSGNSSV
jgi:hypothetical protein